MHGRMRFWLVVGVYHAVDQPVEVSQLVLDVLARLPSRPSGGGARGPLAPAGQVLCLAPGVVVALAHHD